MGGRWDSEGWDRESGRQSVVGTDGGGGATWQAWRGFCTVYGRMQRNGKGFTLWGSNGEAHLGSPSVAVPFSLASLSSQLGTSIARG